MLAILLGVRESDAADPMPEAPLRHRAALGIGPALVGFMGGRDGRHKVEGIRGHARLGYAYSPMRGFEVGADVVQYTLPATLAVGTVRGYWPLGKRDAVEIGFAAHFGAIYATSRSNAWFGWSTFGGPDVRVWLDDQLGIQLSTGACLGIAQVSSSDPGDPYVSQEATFIAITSALAGVARF